MSYARRTDATHAPIREALRQIGAIVFNIHTVGKGSPDLVVGYCGQTILIECKTKRPTRGPYSGGSHGESAAQRALREGWRGGPWWVVTSVDDVLAHAASVAQRTADQLVLTAHATEEAWRKHYSDPATAGKPVPTDPTDACHCQESHCLRRAGYAVTGCRVAANQQDVPP